MLAFGIGLAEPTLGSPAIDSRRNLYFQWLENRVLSPLLPNNPDLWSRTAKHLRNTFTFLSKALDALRANQDKADIRSEEHTSELQSHLNLVCRLLLEKKKYTSA